MTIAGWVLFIIVALSILAFAGCVFYAHLDSQVWGIVTVAIATFLVIALLVGMLWYFDNTAAGQRALVDQKSNLDNGIERTITVYTADGNIIAQYSGKIDIQESDGGYVKFDIDGKRYIYYNCFVETIAEIS